MTRQILFALAFLAIVFASKSDATPRFFFREPPPLRSLIAVIDTPIVDTTEEEEDSLAVLDSLLDSVAYSFDVHGISHRRWHRPHVFVLNQIERTKTCGRCQRRSEMPWTSN